MTVYRHIALASLVCVAGSTAALAQDSVSNSNALPGDALTPYAVGANGNQRKDYAVDLTTLTSSWGNAYLVAPVVKTSLSTPNPSPKYFNHLLGAMAVSNRLTAPGTAPRPTYQAWQTAAQGVNTARNTTPVADGSGRFGPAISPGSPVQSFGLGFMEYGGGFNDVFGDTDDENAIIGGVVSFVPAAPDRVFVSRVVAAINRPNALSTATSNASFGFGSVDEAGAVNFLADGFNMSSADNPVTNRRLYRVETATRNTSVNAVNGTGITDTANSRLLLGTLTNQTTPAAVSRQASGGAGRAMMIGADFTNNFLSEVVVNALATSTTHMAAGASARGPISYIAAPFARLSNGGNDIGTIGALSRAPSATKTRGMSAWVINNTGTIDTQTRVELPTDAALLIDPIDNFSPGATYGSLGNHEMMNYQSQVCFRGGNGPVAMTVLPGSGDLLLASGVAATGGGATVPQSQNNYIAVARISAATGAVTWSVAAHTGGATGAASGISKDILQKNALGQLVTIGEIAKYSEVFLGSTAGPSISSPAMDKYGNLYFMATIQLETLPQATRTVALLRANFNPANNGYQLELLTQIGDVFPGRNSAKNYQVQFLSPADADSVDSGSTWASSVVQDLSAAQTGTIDYGSPASLGALVFRTKIVYDMDGNGQYADPTSAGNSASPDQAYNVVMLVMPPAPPVQVFSLADVATDSLDTARNPNGSVGPEDLDAFISAFIANNAALADVASDSLDTTYNPNGSVGAEDLDAFIAAFIVG